MVRGVSDYRALLRSTEALRKIGACTSGRIPKANRHVRVRLRQWLLGIGKFPARIANMDLHATLIRNVIGPLWARWEGSPYLRHYKRLQQTQYDSPASIRARQWSAIHS